MAGAVVEDEPGLNRPATTDVSTSGSYQPSPKRPGATQRARSPQQQTRQPLLEKELSCQPPPQPPRPTSATRGRGTAALRSHKASAVRFALAVAAGAVLSTGAAAIASATPTMTMLPDISSHYSFTTLGDAADPTFNQLLGVNDFVLSLDISAAVRRPPPTPTKALR